MNEVIQYQYDPAQQSQHMSLKEIFGFTLATGLLLGAGFYFYTKHHEKEVADRSDAQSFSEGSSATIAKQIHMALHNHTKPGGNMPELRQIIGTVKSKDDMDKIATEFENQYHTPLFKSMEDTLQDSEYNELLAIKEAKPQKIGDKVSGDVLYKSWAKRFKTAFDLKYLAVFDALDVDSIKATMHDIPTQRAFVNVGVAYNKSNFGDLLPTLKNRLDASEYYDMMRQLTNKPKA